MAVRWYISKATLDVVAVVDEQDPPVPTGQIHSRVNSKVRAILEGIVGPYKHHHVSNPTKNFCLDRIEAAASDLNTVELDPDVDKVLQVSDLNDTPNSIGLTVPEAQAIEAKLIAQGADLSGTNMNTPFSVFFKRLAIVLEPNIGDLKDLK